MDYSTYNKVNRLILEMQTPFTFSEVVALCEKNGISDKSIMMDALSDLCDSGMFFYHNGRFHNIAYKFSVAQVV